MSFPREKQTIEGNVTETYALHRIKESPLRQLQTLENPPSENLPLENLSENNNPLNGDSFLYLKGAVASFVLQVLIINEGLKLSTVCESIITEVREIESIGAQYFLDAKTKYITPRDINNTSIDLEKLNKILSE